MSHLRALLVLFSAFALVAGGCARGIKLDEDTLSPKIQSTKLYAADGSIITTLRQEENREIIELKNIPQHVRDAVVAIEDSRFYTHKGFDARAIARALYMNATSGKIVEGGSTITQQLVRSSVQKIGREQTVYRKLREASYAYRVDATLSKNKILELYLNTVYFGQGAYGVQTASQTYFGKDVKDLTMAEGATLAGLIKAPVVYDPYSNADGAMRRRNQVLDRMFITKLASRAATAEAKGQPLGIKEKVQLTSYPHAYFVDYITRLIQRDEAGVFEEFGDTIAERTNHLYRGGLRIHTTIDLKMQAAAEEAVKRVLDRPDRDPSASLVAVEPKTGHVKALVGGRDYFAAQQDDPCARFGAIHADGSPKNCAKVNLALGSRGGGTGRQPGSAFKPFALAVGLENGRRLTDVYSAPSCVSIPKADAGGKPWDVCNYEETSFGSSVTLREGTVKSINTVYAQMLVDAGGGDPRKAARKIVDLAKKMGIQSDLEPAVPSVAIGTKSVSALDMASAFSVFPNMGEYIEPVAITKITDATGKTVWEPKQRREQVLNPAISYLVTDVLQEVISRGTGARNAKLGRPAFGKTGTSQEYRDAWWVGGAGTDLVAAVSIFWPDGEISMKAGCSGERTKYELRDGKVITPACRPTRITVVGGSWPAQIWQIFMLKALDGVPASEFPVPEIARVRVSIDVSRGCLPNPYTPQDLVKTVSFIQGTEPTTTCAEPAGPVVGRVPRVVGYPESQAIKLLEQNGYKVEKKTEFSDLYPPGRVIRQEPEGDLEAQAGSSVTIWISTAGVEVPDVVNMTEKDAQQTLNARGLKPKVQRQGGCGQNDSNCFVWDQTPDGGTRVSEGSQVTIQVKPKQ
jgi:membrane peptidoglycan carboxypeptidase